MFWTTLATRYFTWRGSWLAWGSTLGSLRPGSLEEEVGIRPPCVWFVWGLIAWLYDIECWLLPCYHIASPFTCCILLHLQLLHGVSKACRKSTLHHGRPSLCQSWNGPVQSWRPKGATMISNMFETKCINACQLYNLWGFYRACRCRCLYSSYSFCCGTVTCSSTRLAHHSLTLHIPCPCPAQGYSFVEHYAGSATMTATMRQEVGPSAKLDVEYHRAMDILSPAGFSTLS